MLVLGIESATAVASVALADERGLVGEISLNYGFTHSQQLLPMVDALLSQIGIEPKLLKGISVSSGPGSFTGLRIGISLAKGLAQGLNIPVVGISTLEAIAWGQAMSNGLIAPMINAYRDEIYTALFRKKGMDLETVNEELCIKPEAWREIIIEQNEPVLLLGEGVKAYECVWKSSCNLTLPNRPHEIINAFSVAWLGRQKFIQGASDELFTLEPKYIRTAIIGRIKTLNDY